MLHRGTGGGRLRARSVATNKASGVSRIGWWRVCVGWVCRCRVVVGSRVRILVPATVVAIGVGVLCIWDQRRRYARICREHHIVLRCIAVVQAVWLLRIWWERRRLGIRWVKTAISCRGLMVVLLAPEDERDDSSDEQEDRCCGGGGGFDHRAGAGMRGWTGR